MIEFLIFLVALFITFIPTMIAFHRHLKRRWACFIVNILFGWTIIIWAVLGIWSMLTNAVEEPTGLTK